MWCSFSSTRDGWSQGSCAALGRWQWVKQRRGEKWEVEERWKREGFGSCFFSIILHHFCHYHMELGHCSFFLKLRWVITVARGFHGKNFHGGYYAAGDSGREFRALKTSCAREKCLGVLRSLTLLPPICTHDFRTLRGRHFFFVDCIIISWNCRNSIL